MAKKDIVTEVGVEVVERRFAASPEEVAALTASILQSQEQRQSAGLEKGRKVREAMKAEQQSPSSRLSFGPQTYPGS